MKTDLNRASDQFKGLVACWTAQAATPFGLRNMMSGAVATKSGSPTIAGSERGLVLSLTAGFQYWDTVFFAQNALGNMLTWAYWGKSSSSSFQHAMNRDVAGSRSWLCGIENGQMWLDVFNSSGAEYRRNVTVPYADGRWHHFAHTFNGNVSGSITSYFDGRKVDQVASGYSSLYDTSINVKIGAWGYNTGYAWMGLLDDLRIYKTCKSDGEIAQIFKNQNDLYKSFAKKVFIRKTSPAMRWWHGA